MSTTKTRLGLNGYYAQVEPNRCSFLHDGNIEAQCKAAVDLENGMLVEVNKAKGEVKLPTAGDVAINKVGLLYNSEKIYNQFTPGRKNFILKAGEYARVGYLKAGDVFSTNAVCYDKKDSSSETGGYADDAAFLTACNAAATTPLYGHVDTTGAIYVNATATNAVVAVVCALATPDDGDEIKFQVL